MYIEDGYIVTNAHVVWPFTAVRIVFPDGAEFLDVPVVGWDMMVDLAVLGPVEATAPALSFANGEALPIGSDVYLIGYPGEAEEFPEPSLTGGLVSRLREWEAVGVTYFQTDADIAGGQSGGVLVSELGQVIGISGFSFTEARFGLVASFVDLSMRIDQLIAGEAPEDIGARQLFSEEATERDTFTLDNYWDAAAYVVNEPAGTEIDIRVSSEFSNDIHDDGNSQFMVVDAYGRYVANVDEKWTGAEFETFTLDSDIPHFVIVSQSSEHRDDYLIRSGYSLFPYQDSDDGRYAAVGDVIAGNMDYPGDLDHFFLTLGRGDTININVDSVLIDPFLLIDRMEAGEVETDDDSGGGMFGLSAEMSFTAPRSGQYLVVINDAYGTNIGGYILTIQEPYEGAPTPIVVAPTATPFSSPYGRMALYESDWGSFSMQYPANWRDESVSCGLPCYYGSGANVLYIIESFTSEESLDGYADDIVEEYEENRINFELLSREEVTTEQNRTGIVLVYTFDERGYSYKTIEFIYLGEGGVTFRAMYSGALENIDASLAMYEYSLTTFQVID
jgi:hypothetical protein